MTGGNRLRPAGLAAWILVLLGCRCLPQTFGVQGNNGTDSCAAAAGPYPHAAIACRNAAAIEQLLATTWTANSSAAVEALLRHTSVTPGIYGAAIAFTPAAIRKFNITDAPLLSPYCHEPPVDFDSEPQLDDIQCLDIGDIQAGGYNYTDATLKQTAWFTKIANVTSKPRLSGVYFDDGAGNVWMETLSVPVAGPDGRLAGVATADVRAEPPPENATSPSPAPPSPPARSSSPAVQAAGLLLWLHAAAAVGAALLGAA